LDAAGKRGWEGWGGGGCLGPLWMACAGGEEGGGDAAAGWRCAWRPPHPAGRGPGLTCVLSNAIEIVQPCFQSDSLHNMPNICRIGKNMQNNMQNHKTCRICRQYAGDTLKYAEYAIKHIQ
jgi:hypothetical protein